MDTISKLTFLLCFSFLGCSAAPPLTADIKHEHLKTKFEPSESNKYAILINGKCFQAKDQLTTFHILDVQAQEPIHDPFVLEDMRQMTILLTNKGYDIYRIDFQIASIEELEILINQIKEASNGDSKLVIAYSGEGDSKGLRPCTLKVAENKYLIPPQSTIDPDYLFAVLDDYKGTIAMIINACESGIFPNRAPTKFPGVIFSACQEGTKTTPYEPYGTTAIFATFLDLYSDNIHKEIELTEVEMEFVGGWWTNTLHKLLTTTDKEISYTPVIFRNIWGVKFRL